jgi:hypothetical protein
VAAAAIAAVAAPTRPAFAPAHASGQAQDRVQRRFADGILFDIAKAFL